MGGGGGSEAEGGLNLGTSLLCFLSFQLFFLAILFKLTYYSQNYSLDLCQILKVYLRFYLCDCYIRVLNLRLAALLE